MPDIYQSKALAKIYGVPIDKLVDYDSEMVQIEETIKNSDEEKDSKINWTKAWGKKYPILVKYQKEVDIPKYATEIRKMFNQLQQEYKYTELESMLVLKDILGHEYLDNRNK